MYPRIVASAGSRLSVGTFESRPCLLTAVESTTAGQLPRQMATETHTQARFRHVTGHKPGLTLRLIRGEDSSRPDRGAARGMACSTPTELDPFPLLGVFAVQGL